MEIVASQYLMLPVWKDGMGKLYGAAAGSGVDNNGINGGVILGKINGCAIFRLYLLGGEGAGGIDGLPVCFQPFSQMEETAFLFGRYSAIGLGSDVNEEVAVKSYGID